jgi:hypothetical protein
MGKISNWAEWDKKSWIASLFIIKNQLKSTRVSIALQFRFVLDSLIPHRLVCFLRETVKQCNVNITQIKLVCLISIVQALNMNCNELNKIMLKIFYKYILQNKWIEVRKKIHKYYCKRGYIMVQRLLDVSKDNRTIEEIEKCWTWIRL